MPGALPVAVSVPDRALERPISGARITGLRNGARTYCVGCCWSLMLVMFVAGMGLGGVLIAAAVVVAAAAGFTAAG